jgi:branched-chain amino acid transport system ATP-binding protein
MTMLSVQGLRAGYGKIEVLRDVTIVVEQGQIVTLIGANGAGKTTLLKTISGLIRPTAGKIAFEGQNIGRMPAHKIAGSGMSHVPEGRAILKRMTVIDNLRMGAYVRNDKDIDRDIDTVFRRFPALSERRDQIAATLSGGEQQMLAIGRILRTGARLLLLDEPTEGLAPVIIQQIGRTIHALKDEGFTILLVEQNFRFAQTVADRYYIMEHGRIVDGFGNSDLDANVEKLHDYLGV